MRFGVYAFICYILVTINGFCDSYTNFLQAGSESLIANQLDHGSNTLVEVFTNLPDGTSLTIYSHTNCSASPELIYDSSVGISPDNWYLSDGTTPADARHIRFAPGDGAFINPSGSFNLTFTGTPHVPVLPVSPACGYGTYYILSRQTNDVGTYENVTGLSAQEGSQVLTWNGTGFTTNTFTGGAWTPGVPSVGVGQAAKFFIPSPPSYSVNIQAGLNLIANQLDHGSNTLDHGSNTLADVLPEVPDGCVLSKYDNTYETWAVSTFSAASNAWSQPTLTLSPGEGAFFQSPTNFTLTFTGTPHVPVLPVNIPNGATYLLSRQTNDVGNYTNIVGMTPGNGAAMYQWTGSNYTTYTFSAGAWSPAAPSVAVGEAIWISPSGGPAPVAGPSPIFTLQPANISVSQGANATFTSLASGAPPLTYQWYNVTAGPPGTALAGQTQPNLVLTNVQPAQGGNNYQVVVTDSYGTNTSATAMLTVVSGPPQIQQDLQPSYTFFAGQPITLTVLAEGTEPLKFGWRGNGAPLADGGRISGSHSNVLTIANAQLTDSGNTYQLFITNSYGTAPSQTATVTIVPLPSYSLNMNAGDNLIANQLDHGSNTLSVIMTNVPDGCVVFKYDNATGTWSQSTFSAISNSWSMPGMTLSPGEGAFFQSPTNFTLTLTGTPHVPVLPVNIPSGATYLLSRQTNDVGTFENIVGQSPSNGAAVYQWTGTSYTVSTFTGGTWSPSAPSVAVGTAVWISAPGTNPPPFVPVSYAVNIQTGTNIIANQLDHGSNTLSVIMPNVPDGCVLSKYNNTNGSWAVSTFSAAANAWSAPNVTLSPGEGAFFQSPTNFTLTFTGNPHVPVLPVTIPSGATYLLSRQTNDVGNYTNIVGLPPVNGTRVYQFTGSGYAVSAYHGAWNSTPSVPVGTAVWISTPGGSGPPAFPPPLVLNCATNKTVGVGSTWSFDIPTVAQTCSGSNATLVVLGTTTNSGSCSTVFTRTWQVTDTCGNSTTCSQTVTALGVTPPAIAQQPSDLTTVAGQTAALAADTGGSFVTSYQWRHNGQIVATNPSAGPILMFTNAQLSDAGQYVLTITNCAGVATSQVANVTVLAGPLPAGIQLVISPLDHGSNTLDVLVNDAAVGYWALESCTSLASGNWTVVTNGSGSMRLPLSPGGGRMFFRVIPAVLPSVDDQLRAVYGTLPPGRFNTGLLLEVGGAENMPAVLTASGAELDPGTLIPDGAVLTSDGFLSAYSELRRCTLDGNPTIPDLLHATVTDSPGAVPVSLETSLAAKEIYALAVAIVPYNTIDTNAWTDGSLGFEDGNGNPIDPAATNAPGLLPKYVMEKTNAGNYVLTNQFAAAGMFRNVLCSQPGPVAFQIPTNFLVTPGGTVSNLSIRFSGVPALVTNGSTNGPYTGFVRISPGQTFGWDFSGIPVGSNNVTRVNFDVRAVLNGQNIDAMGCVMLQTYSFTLAPPCPNSICTDYVYPSDQPAFWPMDSWTNRIHVGADTFFAGSEPPWWPAYIAWPPPLGSYYTGNSEFQGFGGFRHACDQTVDGPAWDPVAGLGKGSHTSYRLRLYPATHRLTDDTNNLCMAENLIVLVDGIDLLNNRVQQDIWNDVGTDIQKMLDKGYDVLALNYTAGRDYVQRNGYGLKYILEEVAPAYLKPEYSQNQMVVVAASMGTQVARYALCKAEENNEDHHTGLVIYLDGPFIGANIPWSIQGAVKFFAQVKGSASAQARLDGLESPAARQLLRAWENYAPHPDHVAYYQEANALLSGKALPQKVRNVAISSGSGQGFSATGSQAGVTSWNLSYARVATGQQVMYHTNFLGGLLSLPVWGEFDMDAKAEGSTGATDFFAQEQGGLRFLGQNYVLHYLRWQYDIWQGARPADLAPGGYRSSGQDVVNAYNQVAPAGMNTMTGDIDNHSFIPTFSSLYVKSVESGNESFAGATSTSGFDFSPSFSVHLFKDPGINLSLVSSSSSGTQIAGTRPAANFWYGPENAGASIDPQTPALSPFDAIWYQYPNRTHVLDMHGGYEAFLFNELDMFSSHEDFTGESIPDFPVVPPKNHMREVFLFGDLVDGSEDELLTVNTFHQTAMVQRLTSGVWSKLWDSTTQPQPGMIGSWVINKGDKYFLARLLGGKKLLLSFSAATPGWAMVQEFDNDGSGHYSWKTLWSNGGNGQINSAFRVRPTNLYALGDMYGDGTNEEMVAAYPYVCNEVRESSTPGISGLSEVAALQFFKTGPSNSPSYLWASLWSNTAGYTNSYIDKIGGTFVRFGDRLEFGKMSSGLPDVLMSVNMLRNIFGGWAVAQDFNASPPGWNWIWSDYGTGQIGSWTFTNPGNPRDNFHFADLNGDGLGELVNFNDSSWQAQDFTATGPGAGNWNALQTCTTSSTMGDYTLSAGDRFFFGHTDPVTTNPNGEVLSLNPQTKGHALVQRWVPGSSPCWQTLWSSDATPGYLGFWQLYQ